MIVERLDSTAPQPPKQAVLFAAGGIAALLRITQRLQLLELINTLVTKRDQGPSVGGLFDKGNVSEDGMEQLVVSGVHFVAALSANRLSEVLNTPQDQFQDLTDMPGTKAFSTTLPLWGKNCQVVVAYSESFFTQQLSGITQNMVRTQVKLAALQQRLATWQIKKTKGKPPTLKGVQAELKKILAPQFMSSIFHIHLHQQGSIPALSYSVDHEALQNITEHRLGKTILVSDQLHWSAAQIIEAYRNLSRIEATFKNMKNARFLRWQPAHHWTDQKLRVHAFYCVLALLLVSLAHQEVRCAGIDISVPALLQELCAIKEVALIYPPGSGSKSHITLSRLSPKQKRLAELLDVHTMLAKG